MSDVTRILSAIESGDPHTAEQLLPLVYDELRKVAAQKMAQEKPGKRSTPPPWSTNRIVVGGDETAGPSAFANGDSGNSNSAHYGTANGSRLPS